MTRTFAFSLFVLSLLMLILVTAGIASAHPRSAADRWERSLLAMKANGTLPGPRSGQRCLWSPKLHACLWYTPAKWEAMLRIVLANIPSGDGK